MCKQDKGERGVGMDKLDLRKTLKEFYTASARKPKLVDVPAHSFLMLDGAGDPESAPAFHEAIQALYTVAYTLKFGLKKAGAGPDFSVMALEGLWWTDRGSVFNAQKRDTWKWTLMILQPDHITKKQVGTAICEAHDKKGMAILGKVRFERFCEGPCAQIMHVGPYSDELPTIERLHAFIEKQGYRPAGKHHEIYMGDPRRAKPEKLKTILRQPVA
jgi:hypothetical protein